MKKVPTWKTLVLIAAVAFIIVVATFSWFVTGPKATVDNIYVDMGKATYVQVSGSGGDDWQDDLEISLDVDQVFKEISGDGTTFYAPIYQDYVGTDGVFSKKIVGFETTDKYVYEKTFDFRSKTEQDIFLDVKSYVNPVNGGYMNSAIRVAFFEEVDGEETLKYIWAPNSKVEYNGDFTTNGSVESGYSYQVGTKVNDFVRVSTSGRTDEYGCGYYEGENMKMLWTNGEHMPEDVPMLVALTNPTPNVEDSYCYGTIKVRVWLEGYDRECVKELSGKKFIIGLNFVAREPSSEGTQEGE